MKQNKTINIAVLAYPNLCLFEFACAVEVFGQSRPEFQHPHYAVSICDISSKGENTPSTCSPALSNSCQVSDLPSFDLIVVPGWQGVDIEPEATLRNALLRAHSNGSRIASICSGAFLLAHAGLLENRKATTHWQYLDTAKEMFPNTQFESAALYQEDERVITSAGSAAGLDMCLHIVRSDFGQSVANSYARRLVIPPFRDGGQAQFIAQPMPNSSSSDERLAKLLQFLEENIADHHSVTSMAAVVHLSERHFLRLFKAQFGVSPAKWLIRLRLQRACELLESSTLGIKNIAQHCGLGSEETLRHHFRRNLKTSPIEYRNTFAAKTGVSIIEARPS